MAYQQIASYFTESTKPIGNVGGKWGQKGYTYGVTAESAVLSNTANTLVSYPIGYTASTNTIPRNHFSGSKVIIGADVTVAYDDVVATLIVEASHDGTNWFTAATVVADTTPNVTGQKTALADLSTIYAPYYRIGFNGGGLNCGTSGKLKFFYCVPNPD